MEVDKTLITPVLIILFVLAITIFSYFELESVFVFTDLIIESHATNLLLLDDLKIQIHNLETEILYIHSDENISQEDIENSYERITNAKIEMYEILESNTSLDQEFVNMFIALIDNVFPNVELLNDYMRIENTNKITSLLSDVNDTMYSIHILLESESKNVIPMICFNNEEIVF